MVSYIYVLKKLNSFNSICLKKEELEAELMNTKDENKIKELEANKKNVVFLAIFSVGFYATFTSSMVFLNKAVLSSYAFHDISLLLLFE